MMPALIAGTGLGVLPEFIVRDALADGSLERLLPEWSMASGSVYWVTPPSGRSVWMCLANSWPNR
jgi:DNA-binding transcriptional LysR family regulator